MTYNVTTSDDGTKLIEFEQGHKSVLIPSKDEKITLCVSCQIGCGMKCLFCRAGKFVRNLSFDEIISQVRVGIEVWGKVPTSVVFMGMGEPMLNFDVVSQAIEWIHTEFSLTYKKITLSTSGINLDKLVDVPYNVAISLHSADDKVRQDIMPGVCGVGEVVNFAKEYCALHKYGIMIEYALISGINDSDKDLDKLISLKWPKNTNFNLIEFNTTRDFTASGRLEEWKEKIIKSGFKCFIRGSRGKDIEAACGMLDQN